MIATQAQQSAVTRPLALRTRGDLRTQLLHFDRRRFWGVKDPVSLRYYQLRDEEYSILQMLDGRTSLLEIQDRFERDYAPRRISLPQLQSFLSMLHHEGLIVSEAPGQGQQLLERQKTSRRRELWSRLGNLLAIRFRGFDPEGLLRALYPNVAWVFSRWCVACVLMLAAAALLLVSVHFRTLQARLPDFQTFFSVKNAMLLVVTLAVTKVLHEFGHAFALRRYGGECHEMGVMLLAFTPCLYCNVSDAWMLPNKWHRIFISAAGMYLEIGLASVATFLWWFSHPGLLNSMCLNLMFVCSISTIVFNGNPLLRYDGYFILADLWEVPNLRQNALAVVKQRLGRWFLGVELTHQRMLPERRHRLLAVYAVASIVYRWVVVISILWFCHQVLKPYRLESLVRVLAVTVVAGLLAGPAIGVVRFLTNPARNRDVKWRQFFVRSGLLAAVVAFACLVPLPYSVTVPVVLEPQGARRVYVSVPGTLQKTTEAGTPVTSGQVLAELENLELRTGIARLEGQRNQKELRLQNLHRRSFRDNEARDQIPAAEKELDDLEGRLAQRRRDLDELTLTAPADGTVLPPKPADRSPEPGQLRAWSGSPLDERNVGCFLQTGTLFCKIGDPQRLEANLVVDQSDIEFVRTGQVVRLNLDEVSRSILTGKIIEIAEIDVDVAPRELTYHQDLPVRSDDSGVVRPLNTSYQVRVSLDRQPDQLLIGTAGRAKIEAEPQSLSRRLARYLKRTLRFDL